MHQCTRSATCSLVLVTIALTGLSDPLRAAPPKAAKPKKPPTATTRGVVDTIDATTLSIGFGTPTYANFSQFGRTVRSIPIFPEHERLSISDSTKIRKPGPPPVAQGRAKKRRQQQLDPDGDLPGVEGKLEDLKAGQVVTVMHTAPTRKSRGMEALVILIETPSP